jgi:hypothetical protein
MDCLKCVHVEQVFQSRVVDYCEVRSAAFYQVSTELAAKKNVDMERARYDMEEHRLICPRVMLVHLNETAEASD